METPTPRILAPLFCLAHIFLGLIHQSGILWEGFPVLGVSLQPLPLAEECPVTVRSEDASPGLCPTLCQHRKGSAGSLSIPWPSFH